MGWEFSSSCRVKKTRQPHNCAYCGRIIPAKSPNIEHWWGKFDGDFQNSYACHWCEDHKESLNGDEEMLDIWDALREDVFYEEFQKYKQCECHPHEKYPNVQGTIRAVFENDDLVFKCESCKKEFHRISMPIISLA